MSKKPTLETFDWVQLDKYLQFKISLKMAGELMECHPNTIKNYIKEKFDMTFTEYSDIKMSKIKVKLVQKALDMALKNNNVTMLIFCLKNICKWADKQDVDHTVNDNIIKMAYDITGQTREKSE